MIHFSLGYYLKVIAQSQSTYIVSVEMSPLVMVLNGIKVTILVKLYTMIDGVRQIQIQRWSVGQGELAIAVLLYRREQQERGKG